METSTTDQLTDQYEALHCVLLIAENKRHKIVQLLLTEDVFSVSASFVSYSSGLSKTLPCIGEAWIELLVDNHVYQLNKQSCETAKVDKGYHPVHNLLSYINLAMSF